MLFIVNKSLITGKFTCSRKETKVKPLYKTGAKDDKNNYRPISILPTVSKLEKWVESQFSKYLNEYNFHHQSQSGFRSKHSTESAIVRMIDSWLNAVNDGKLTGCVMVDLRKAFDLVDHKIHKILLNKLKCYKCDVNCLSWFESYLSKITQRVSLNSNLSTPVNLKCVPQGSILGPLLFLIFINDLPLVLQNYVVVDLFADDTTFYDFQFDITQLETNLQHALSLLRIWCRQNGMVLNTDKTKVMLITSRQKRLSMHSPVLSLTYSDIDIK